MPPKTPKTPKLTENVDYTFENGFFVFTRDYLLGRGQCCGSGCRNCPYLGGIKIISMVPSWTETLIACGANVVGRTRFCIHPEKIAAKAIGGTKDWNLENVRDLQAELIVFDREENPKVMADEAPAPWIATDIRSVHDVAPEFVRLAEKLAKDAGVAARLRKLAERWTNVLTKASEGKPVQAESWPGMIEWLRPPVTPSRKVAYVIWRDPWMTVAPKTFIGSVLELLGFEIWRPPSVDPESKYPVFDFETIDPDVVVLFASEPFPFAKKRNRLEELGRPSALVDGERFSWFGLRTLEFLEIIFDGSRR